MLVATAVVPESDLVRLVASLTPVTVTIDEERGRVVTIGPLQQTQLVAGAGLRLRGDARVSWDFAGLPIPVTVEVWQLLLQPKIVSNDGAHVLLFEPVLEDLELKLVPGIVDEKVADAIRDGLARNRDRLAWNFARTLSRRIPLPARVAPATTFEILAVGGDVSVTESEMRLVLRFEARFFEARTTVVDAEKASHAEYRGGGH
jgi:hypothetical protein